MSAVLWVLSRYNADIALSHALHAQQRRGKSQAHQALDIQELFNAVDLDNLVRVLHGSKPKNASFRSEAGRFVAEYQVSSGLRPRILTLGGLLTGNAYEGHKPPSRKSGGSFFTMQVILVPIQGQKLSFFKKTSKLVCPMEQASKQKRQKQKKHWQSCAQVQTRNTKNFCCKPIMWFWCLFCVK